MEVVESSGSEDGDGEFDPATSRCFGQPMVCRFEASKRLFTDGFGLCSPGRWAPAALGRTATEEESSQAKLITSVLERFVKEHLGDARECSFRLAGTDVTVRFGHRPHCCDQDPVAMFLLRGRLCCRHHAP